MALMQCPECGINVSTQAESCPKCGFPFAAAPSPSRANRSGTRRSSEASGAGAYGRCPKCANPEVIQCSTAYESGTAHASVQGYSASSQTAFARRASPPSSHFRAAFGLLFAAIGFTVAGFFAWPLIVLAVLAGIAGPAVLIFAVLNFPNYLRRRARWNRSWICLRCSCIFDPERPEETGPSPVGVLLALFPALVFVLVATGAATWVWLNPAKVKEVTDRFNEWSERNKKGDSEPKTPEGIRGKWKVVSEKSSGKELREKAGLSVVIDADSISYVDQNGKAAVAFRYKLDATKEPKEIDVSKEAAGQPSLGIYALEGDTLKICVAEPSVGRPKEFSSKLKSKYALTIFQREK